MPPASASTKIDPPDRDNKKASVMLAFLRPSFRTRLSSCSEVVLKAHLLLKTLTYLYTRRFLCRFTLLKTSRHSS